MDHANVAPFAYTECFSENFKTPNWQTTKYGDVC